MWPSVSVVKYYRKTLFGLKPAGIDSTNLQLPERTKKSQADYTTCALTAFKKYFYWNELWSTALALTTIYLYIAFFWDDVWRKFDFK